MWFRRWLDEKRMAREYMREMRKPMSEKALKAWLELRNNK